MKFNKTMQRILTGIGLYSPRTSNNVNLYRKLSALIEVNKIWNQWQRYDSLILKKYKNVHSNQRCFIIGNGPSLSKMDLSLLKKEITFTSNAIFLKFSDMGFTPSYYFVEDVLVAEDRRNEINKLKNITKFFPIHLSYLLTRDEETIYLNQKDPLTFPMFSTDAARVTYCGYSVTYLCMQMAFYMGFSKVYLIGVDYDYVLPNNKHINSENIVIISENDDINHFHPNYFGKGYRWHHPKLDKVKQSYILAKQVFESNHRKIYNATCGGKLEVFERVRYEELF